MVNETDQIACRYIAQIEDDGGRYTIEVPDAEVEFGSLAANGAYHITIEHTGETQRATDDNAQQAETDTQSTPVQAPVAEGEELDVEIEDVGQQGDGIARVGPGYVLIVPGSEVGDELTVEVQQVTPNFGFAEIIDEETESAGEETPPAGDAEADETATEPSATEADPDAQSAVSE